MTPKFNKGDKVKLVSGGPEMTIRDMHYDVLTNQYNADIYDCIWFDKNLAGKTEVHYCPFFEVELIKL